MVYLSEAMEDSKLMWGIEWYTIDRGRWRIRECRVFKLNEYWFKIKSTGMLVDKATGETLIVDKNFYCAGRWRIEIE